MDCCNTNSTNVNNAELLCPFIVHRSKVGFGLDKNIILMSNDLSFLKEKWELIANYTKKIDPVGEIGTFEMTEGDDEVKEIFGFSHYVFIEETLPRPVRALYGDHTINQRKGNCHGAAVLAAGIFPAMCSLGTPYALSLTARTTHEVAKDALSSGDLVFLKKGPNGQHSFVFLDDDLSLSMNGAGKPLEICRTSDILKKYGYPENILKKSSDKDGGTQELHKNITILRKNNDWNYPEEIMPSLLDYYNFSEPCPVRSDPAFQFLKGIAKKLQNFSSTPQAEGQWDRQSRVTIFNELTSSMPYGVLE